MWFNGLPLPVPGLLHGLVFTSPAHERLPVAKHRSLKHTDDAGVFGASLNIASLRSSPLPPGQRNWRHSSPESKNLPISISVFRLFIK